MTKISLSKLFSKNSQIFPLLIACFFAVLFLSNSYAGIVEDVIKEQKLDMKRVEDRCKLSDYLTKMIENSDKRLVKGHDYTEYEICEGSNYEVKDDLVFVGSQGERSNLAQCYSHDFFMFRIFRYSNIKIASVSRGHDNYYFVPVNMIYFTSDNKSVTVNNVSSNTFMNGYVIKANFKPKHKIDFYKIKNCDIKVY